MPVGGRVYEAAIKKYTVKEWKTEPKMLPLEVIARLPVQLNNNNLHFNDTWEGLPLEGYTAW